MNFKDIKQSLPSDLNIKKIQEENVYLRKQLELQKILFTNQADVVKVISSFYSEALREIEEDFSFDLTKLLSVRTVMSDC